MLVAGTFVFSRNWMGGGDVKLLAAGALWCNFSAGWKMLVAVAIAGGIETILILFARKFDWSDRTLERFEFLRRRGGVPYGIAIAAGLILATWWFRRHHYIFWF